MCVSDVGRLVERGSKRGQGKGCREADTTGSPETCPERLRVGEGEQDGQDGPWGHSWRIGVGTGMQWTGIRMRHKGTDRGHEEATSKCRRGMTRGRGGVDVRGAWVHLLVFEVTVRNIMAMRVPVRSDTD